jgi:DNA repair exonuclease SbcCD ATPase subunit
MIIKQIKLQNFGNHKELIVNLTDGLNIITGETGAGKSTIFRALALVINNHPLNATKIFNSPNYRITVTTDKFKIIRKPKEYILFMNGHKQSFNAFGTKVPPPIKNLFNLKPINWQRQLNKHFLIFDSPGNVAKYINDLSGTEHYEKIIDDLKKKTGKLNSDKKVQILMKQEAKQEMDKLKGVPEIKEKLGKLNKRKNKYDKRIKMVEELKRIIDKIISISDIKITLEKIQEIEKLAISLLEKISKGIEKSKLLKNLRGTIVKLKELNNLDLEKYNPSIHKLEELLSVNSEVITRLDHLQGLRETLKSINENKKTMGDLQKEISSLEKEHKNLLNTLKICPTCNQKIRN